MMPVDKPTGLRRLWLALGYSLKGLRSAFRYEAAFRQEVLLLLLAVPLAFLVAQTGLQVVLLIGVVLLVLVVELLNSAIENVVDRLGEEFHPLAGRAKDQGSAAVLVALVLAGLVWFAVVVLY